jgi:hypothetical protein
MKGGKSASRLSSRAVVAAATTFRSPSMYDSHPASLSCAALTILSQAARISDSFQFIAAYPWPHEFAAYMMVSKQARHRRNLWCSLAFLLRMATMRAGLILALGESE